MTLGNVCHLFSVRIIRRAVSAIPITTDQLKPISNPRILLLSIFHSADCSAKLCKTEHGPWKERMSSFICRLCSQPLHQLFSVRVPHSELGSHERLLLVLAEIRFGETNFIFWVVVFFFFLHFTMLAHWWEFLHAIMYSSCYLSVFCCCKHCKMGIASAIS